MLWQDVLQGKYDAHVPAGSGEHFRACKEMLETAKANGAAGSFGYLFDTFAALCHALELKAELGVNLKKAYDAGDRAALADLRDNVIPETINRVGAFYRALRAQWMKENKSFGFDVQDVRIGTLKARLEAAITAIDEYLNGTVSSIEELEAPRMLFAEPKPESNDGNLLYLNNWEKIASANVL
jgi:hypothetical protein